MNLTLATLRDALTPRLISGEAQGEGSRKSHGPGSRMTPLHPWANGPFELLVHAEEHLRLGEDVYRRIALIGFDNAIEIAIGSYLLLKPIQRGGKDPP